MKKLFFILLVSSGVLINADIIDEKNTTIEKLKDELMLSIANRTMPDTDKNGNSFLHRIFKAALNAQSKEDITECAKIQLAFEKGFERYYIADPMNNEGYNLRGELFITMRDICDENNSRYDKRTCNNAAYFMKLVSWGDGRAVADKVPHTRAIYPITLSSNLYHLVKQITMRINF